jgi:DNA-binding PadR family transcriptional regulator
MREPSPLAFHVLLSLLEGERHGYAIKREIVARTQKRLSPGPSLLYGTIHRLLDQGWIAECQQRPDAHLDDERRTYYRILPEGVKALQAEARRMQELVKLAGAYVAL